MLAHLPDGVVNARIEVRVPLALDLLVAEGPLFVERDAPALPELCACRLPGLLHIMQSLFAEPDLFGESREDSEVRQLAEMIQFLQARAVLVRLRVRRPGTAFDALRPLLRGGLHL